MATPGTIAELLINIKKQNRWQEIALALLIAAVGLTGLYIIIMGVRTLSLDLNSFVKLLSGSAVAAFVYFPINKLQEILEVERGFFILATVIQENIGKLDNRIFLYNKAAAESMLGKITDSLETLEKIARLQEQIKDIRGAVTTKDLLKDPDLQALRESSDPSVKKRFERLLKQFPSPDA